MCRLMLINTRRPQCHTRRLRQFAAMCRANEEYQGHGWGAGWWDGEQWHAHRSLTPIWEEGALDLPVSDRLLVHARSAFRNEDVVLQNNMPFPTRTGAYAFNGELHGVRLRMPGRTGARKILNLLGTLGDAADPSTNRRARDVLTRRTQRILGMNWIVTGPTGAVVSSHAGERPDYYTLHRTTGEDETVVCSTPLDGDQPWRPLAAGISEVPWWSS